MTIDFDLKNIDIPMICTLKEDLEEIDNNEEDMTDTVSIEQV